MTKMFKIALPDGSVKEMPEGSTPADVAAAIGPGLAKAALAAKINGEIRDITRPFECDANLALITSRDEAEALELVRHDYAHVLAEAVQNIFRGTQITFGPATEDGFYYDFAPAPGRGPFTEEDLPAIEEDMRRIIAADKLLVREVWRSRPSGSWNCPRARPSPCTVPAKAPRHGSTFAAVRTSLRRASSIQARSS
jgi:threonyl-tRNA synthetase